MKSQRALFIILFFMVIFLFPTFLTAQNDQNSVKEMNSGRMLGIHFYSLKDGVTSTDFEDFIVKEFNPLMRGLFPGVEIKFMKGEKGPKTGSYILVYDIQSQFVRNFYWPRQGSTTDASNNITNACGEKCEKLRTRMMEFLERDGWADYIEVNENNIDNL